MSIKSLYPDIRPSLNLDFANSKSFDPRITFTRNSSALYHDGKTTSKAEENLLERSSQINTTYWSSFRNTITDGQTDPFGGTGAAKLTGDGGTGGGTGVYRSPVYDTTLGSGIFTLSIYAKADQTSKVYIGTNNGGGQATCVDLSTGTIVLTATNNTSNIIALDGGWYRISTTFDRNQITVSNFFIVGLYNSTSFVSETFGTDQSIFIYGPQIEKRERATIYIPTTDKPIIKYQPTLVTAPANYARFDHDLITKESLGLLIEEQKTNYCDRSSEFNNGSGWGDQGALVTPEAAVAPDGTITADKISDRSSTSSGFGLYDISFPEYSSSSTWTYSMFAKAGEYNWLRMTLWSSDDPEVWFDLSTGTIGNIGSENIDAGIKDYGNGWYRCWVVRNTSTYNHASAQSPRFGLSTGNGIGAFNGVGNKGIYVWGAQLEPGTFPTSYIAADTTQETRASDYAYIEGSNFFSWWNQDEGTFLIDVSYGNFANQPIAISDDPGNAWIYAQGTSELRSYYVPYTGSTLITTNYNLSINTHYKFAASFDSNTNEKSLYRDGVVYEGGTNPIKPSSRLYLGNFANAYSINGHIRKLSFYPEKLPDNEILNLLK